MTDTATKDKKTQTTHQFTAEVDKILSLMINSLYANKEIFLRELVSNASDACDKLRYEAAQDESLQHKDQELKITISSDEKAGTLTITDNGIGMSKEELQDNLGTIARSGTQRFIDSLTGDKNKDMQLIGQFGVGFYSSFMVADEVTVISTKAGEKASHIWQSKGDGSYSIDVSDTSHPVGTSITLHLKEDCKQYIDKHRISHIVTTYSNHIGVPIEFVNEKGGSESLNSGSALWTRAKDKITEDEHKEFYKSCAHAIDDPWLTLHNRVEGTIEFTNLLYVPTKRPFDLFHPDRATRVKLYVKRVFITDENNQLLPAYLRFVRGVVDSEDLPLNISRETLQHNALINKIQKNLVKRILDELKKQSDKDQKGYTEFWTNFGAVLKEGLCENVDANREKLLDICRFKTTKSGDGLISLQEYIDRMQDGQQTIYYITGENIDMLKNSPQLEGFQKKDVEVLLLDDHVDGFWVNVVHDYNEKSFKSVTSSNIDLDKKEEDASKKDEDSSEDKEEKKEEKPALSKEESEIIALFKTSLEGKVNDVIISKRLTESPVCLTVPEGAMDSRMERFLIDQNQLATAAPKNLEVNPDHAIVKHLHASKDSALNKELAELLFDQACIIEGENISNPSDFAKRMNNVIARVVKVAA